jgi:hypothetical protein
MNETNYYILFFIDMYMFSLLGAYGIDINSAGIGMVS